MTYGEHTGLTPEKLKRVFSDAMRWQLKRILEDQTGSAAPRVEHATTSSVWGEVWDFLAHNGPDARWAPEDHDRLLEQGWSADPAKEVARVLRDFEDEPSVSGKQIDAYLEKFEIAKTQDNVIRIERTVCHARAAACREATERLDAELERHGSWIEDALVDEAPFALELMLPPRDGNESPPEPKVVADPPPAPLAPVPVADVASAPPEATQQHKKLLLEACEECIAAHQKHDAWSPDTIKQARTALALFDHACGGGAFAEDLVQGDISKFIKLCESLPNRWRRTSAERAGGIAASLERAKSLPPGEVGISQATINKHLSWIKAVLDHAAGEEGD